MRGCGWLLLALGCTPGPELWDAPDPARDGLEGSDGPYGAASRIERAPARVTEVLRYEVVYPATADAAPDPTAGPAPVIALVQGGLVAPERYRWMARHWATRGYVTVLPDHDANLALIEPGNAAIAIHDLRRDGLDGLVQPEGFSAIVGHSLGGVVAAKEWTKEEEEAVLLVLLAGYAAKGDDVESQTRPVLAIAGSTDQSLDAEDMRAEMDRFVAVRFEVLDGMNHYGWTDDATPGELDGDGPLQGELDVLRTHAHTLIDATMDAVLQQDGDAATRLGMPFGGFQ